ncbi:sugar phosphate isomerase/epimerase family protein [Paenibacillus sp. GCM10023248]|uniref:sugar phosphate isomerase/epimerase family protein n=1 Tax=unclassified Paenibacillus TaxID=185978 RepID=UPI002378C42B|nr:TIM barrel protein [Paenibacillus sp. MAHUQ-63]MDD9269497.1 TIM barrel protein [Paenibacillus sp. MAHUQ-63]
MKLSVCMDSLFKGWDLGDALQVVQANGIGAFEFWNWKTKDIGRLEAEMKSRSLTLSAFCTNGGTLVSKEAHRAYVEGIKDAAQISKRLGCSTLITTAGAEQPGVERESQLEHIVAGLRWPHLSWKMQALPWC